MTTNKLTVHETRNFYIVRDFYPFTGECIIYSLHESNNPIQNTNNLVLTTPVLQSTKLFKEPYSEQTLYQAIP